MNECKSMRRKKVQCINFFRAINCCIAFYLCVWCIYNNNIFVQVVCVCGAERLMVLLYARTGCAVLSYGQLNCTDRYFLPYPYPLVTRVSLPCFLRTLLGVSEAGEKREVLSSRIRLKSDKMEDTSVVLTNRGWRSVPCFLDSGQAGLFGGLVGWLVLVGCLGWLDVWFTVTVLFVCRAFLPVFPGIREVWWNNVGIMLE